LIYFYFLQLLQITAKPASMSESHFGPTASAPPDRPKSSDIHTHESYTPTTASNPTSPFQKSTQKRPSNPPNQSDLSNHSSHSNTPSNPRILRGKTGRLSVPTTIAASLIIAVAFAIVHHIVLKVLDGDNVKKALSSGSRTYQTRLRHSSLSF
jgi:hypothetical protein